MPSTWVAVDAGIDPVSWARLLRRAYDHTVIGGIGAGLGAASIVRPVIGAWWARSKHAGVDLEHRPPIMLEPQDVLQALRRSPTCELLTVVKSILLQVAEHAHQAVVLTDPAGQIIWTDGDPEICRKAERINLVPGARWSEDACGTNAIGTAIALGHPIQVFSAEHFKRMLHGWSAAAAPIQDPATGEVIAVIALTGSFKRAHPHGFSLVVAAAHITEAHLRHEATESDERLKVEYLEQILAGCSEASAVVNTSGRVLLASPPGWIGSRLGVSSDGGLVAPPTEPVTVTKMHRGDGFMVVRDAVQQVGVQRPVLRLQALGCDRAGGSLGQRAFEFTPRHSEILVILAQHPEGLSEESLAAALYGAPIKKVTIRAEISRLRRLLGSAICTRPYRLAADVHADFLDPLSQFDAGGEAQLTGRPGRLLPSSTAPMVVEMRMQIERALDAAADLFAA